jgi:hypothetical protein
MDRAQADACAIAFGSYVCVNGKNGNSGKFAQTLKKDLLVKRSESHIRLSNSKSMLTVRYSLTPFNSFRV